MDDETRQAFAVMLGPKNFRGQCRTIRYLDQLAPKPHGTSVSILADGVKEWALEDLVRFFPVPIRINGQEMPNPTLLDEATRIFEHDGAVIGLFEGLIYWNGTTDLLRVPVDTTTGVPGRRQRLAAAEAHPPRLPSRRRQGEVGAVRGDHGARPTRRIASTTGGVPVSNRRHHPQ